MKFLLGRSHASALSDWFIACLTNSLHVRLACVAEKKWSQWSSFSMEYVLLATERLKFSTFFTKNAFALCCLHLFLKKSFPTVNSDAAPAKKGNKPVKSANFSFSNSLRKPVRAPGSQEIIHAVSLASRWREANFGGKCRKHVSSRSTFWSLWFRKSAVGK